jgi:hypothetical protein
MSHYLATIWLARMRKALARVTRRVPKQRFVSKATAPGALRVMYVANSFIPTLQLSFVKPLQALVDEGQVAAELLSEQQMKDLFGKNIRKDQARTWIRDRIHEFKPNILLFCRYSGPHAEAMLDLAREEGISTIFHIDDDLLNVPLEIGKAKYDFHNHPARLSTVRALLAGVDLVYCSTTGLLQRLQAQGLDQRGVAGQIYCSGEVLSPAPQTEVLKIGYMGFDHAHDFQLVLPSLVRVLEEQPLVQFELFGSIPKPPELERFGSRVTVIPPVPDYQQFMAKFASLGWAIGICPLAETPFNAVKANTKWVEYTAIGAAVIATAGTVYDDCCSQGCGLLVADKEDWYEAINSLLNDPTARLHQVSFAQQRLDQQYSIDALREQIMTIFRAVR